MLPCARLGPCREASDNPKGSTTRRQCLFCALRLVHHEALLLPASLVMQHPYLPHEVSNSAAGGCSGAAIAVAKPGCQRRPKDFVNHSQRLAACIKNVMSAPEWPWRAKLRLQCGVVAKVDVTQVAVCLYARRGQVSPYGRSFRAHCGAKGALMPPGASIHEWRAWSLKHRHRVAFTFCTQPHLHGR